ncbi:hypothetical protein PF008_g8191 [Phytophthora fragariae]|uniref:Uncharacterized protein n=1 Tax=Phytophthora fragariae TaxID=53985 RepID=A0A6G0S0V5_9STRA|nr:hypothetical protein PF008_g8191 [Phytophthora fragariae]
MLAALRAYKTINGDTLVPQSFVVPSGDARWPRVAWGYALGGTRSLCQLCAIFTKYTATRMFRGRLLSRMATMRGHDCRGTGHWASRLIVSELKTRMLGK